jgi:hypothetical protein
VFGRDSNSVLPEYESGSLPLLKSTHLSRLSNIPVLLQLNTCTGVTKSGNPDPLLRNVFEFIRHFIDVDSAHPWMLESVYPSLNFLLIFIYRKLHTKHELIMKFRRSEKLFYKA